MAKQWTKAEKIKIIEFGMKTTQPNAAIKYNISLTTIKRWTREFKINPDMLDWGRGIQIKSAKKRKIQSKFPKTKNVEKMTRSELEEVARFHFELKKYEAKTFKQKFFAIFHLKNKYSILWLCKQLKVSRGGYYKWLRTGKPQYKNYNVKTAHLIEETFYRFKGVYGYPMLTLMINIYRKIKLKPWIVYRYMRILGLKAKRTKNKVKYPESGNTFFPNILNRNFKTNRLNHKWVTDVTYIRTSKGIRYLSIVRDLFNGEIVDWVLSKNIDNNLCHSNLIRAWNIAGKPKGVIIHSDQGSSYTCSTWKFLCKKMKFIPSMSRRGNSPDNGACETWFSSFKQECIYIYNVMKLNDNNLYSIISNYVRFYNYIRPILKNQKTPFQMRREFIS